MQVLKNLCYKRFFEGFHGTVNCAVNWSYAELFSYIRYSKHLALLYRDQKNLSKNLIFSAEAKIRENTLQKKEDRTIIRK
ncbi:hypothetical protein DP113_14310 [Brasilonema octagenarum UFV-E1]|uniref:Uncharacterized protein n=2 Tax=Brasilonema TaxID=383614 RepID=A0A856MIF4_9CYAN|nr:hypothetical protein [Brasilonema octagenarum UFV-OR1]QDL08927.1 hypothetical protein DP114_14380 [Brasilonema sennae CENA114]QDL15283.1 hypothetical protein DP113_14310 [Brasilonema octagenarum UFV-E1]